MSLYDAFREGGWPMFPILLSGLLLFLAAARYAMRPEARRVPLLWALGIVTLLWGGAGFTLGMIKTLGAMGQVPPEQRYIVLIGLGECLNDVALALLLVLLGSMTAAVGAWRRSRGDEAAAATMPAI